MIDSTRLISIAYEAKNMELTKKEAFVKQLVIYMKDSEVQKAYLLAQEFVKKFPGEMVSHFLLGRAAFAVRKFEEAKLEARKAFGMSKTDEDMVASALLVSTAHLELKEYAQGYEILRRVEDKSQGSDVQTAMVVFSVALKDEKEVMNHLNKLYKVNERLGSAMAMRILNSS
jgi:tetratricopeptide (TPR) repeat protein